MTTETQDEELRRRLLKLDVILRGKQSFWETPKAILLIVVTTATIAGLLGFKFGSTPPPPIVIQLVQPPAAKWYRATKETNISLQLGALRAALLAAGADPAKADAAAEEVAGYENRLTRLTVYAQISSAILVLLLGSQFALWQRLGDLGAQLAGQSAQLATQSAQLAAIAHAVIH